MTTPLLAAVANATSVAAEFTSTNGSGADNINLPALTNTFTGGKGHTPISVPQASSMDYLLGQNGQSAHNMQITAADGSWDIYLWSNDSQQSALYWMFTDISSFDSATRLDGSQGTDVTSAIYISMNNDLLSVKWNGVQRV